VPPEILKRFLLREGLQKKKRLSLRTGSLINIGKKGSREESDLERRKNNYQGEGGIDAERAQKARPNVKEGGRTAELSKASPRRRSSALGGGDLWRKGYVDSFKGSLVDSEEARLSPVPSGFEEPRLRS